jgi:hypothetical protein
MKTMNFDGPGFKLQVPTDWFITSSPQIQAMFVSPPREGGRANFMVTLRPLDENVTLEQVSTTSLETQKKEYKQFKLLQEAPVQKGDINGHRRLYSWFSEEHNAKIMQQQVLFVANRMLTTITTTRTDLPVTEEVEPIFTQMIESFQFV